MYFDSEIEVLKTEDYSDTMRVVDANNAGIDLTTAVFDNWVRQYSDSTNLIVNANIQITLANQTTNPGEFTVFIDKTHYASLLGNYILRFTITLAGIETTIGNYKLCINN